MKFKSLFLTSAAALALAACSSDEPANSEKNDGSAEGSTMYLAVNITDANAMSRADEGDLVPGNQDEHAVTTAHFFFFDANKVFVTEANVWQNGTSGNFEPTGKDDEGNDNNYNVEFQSNNVLVLKNLSQKNLPKYLITVLNAPQELLTYIRATPRTMEQVRNFTLNYLNGSKFVMSTSSFMEGATAFPGKYDNDVYYANLLQESDLKTEPIDINTLKDTDVVKIYVERLAAKYTINLPAGNPFPVDVTIAGNVNNEGAEDTEGSGSIGATKVYVKINNFGVTGVEEESYLGKNLEGFSASDLWDTWNISKLHRCYWGKSVNYDNNANLSYTTFTGVNGDIQAPVYSNETTKKASLIRVDPTQASKLIPSRVTNIVFTANVYEDQDCTKPLDLILYSGVYYKKDQFIPYILSRLNASNSLNFYKKTGTQSETNEDGTLNIDNYTQVSASDVTYAKDGSQTGVCKLISNIGKDTKLYKLEETVVDGAKKTVATEVSHSDFETALNSYFTNQKPSAYTGGATVYYVPVEHLLGQNAGYNGNNDYTVAEDGVYGVVRNHWYQIDVNKVFRLGQGVYDPSDGSTEDLIPDDPTKETFGMAAQISILSWKIVKQSVDL